MLRLIIAKNDSHAKLYKIHGMRQKEYKKMHILGIIPCNETRRLYISLEQELKGLRQTFLIYFSGQTKPKKKLIRTNKQKIDLELANDVFKLNKPKANNTLINEVVFWCKR